MSLFSQIEKGIERGFRRWTESMFGQADSGELLTLHRAILEKIEGKVQTVARGKRVFPFAHLTITLFSEIPERRALYEAAFSTDGRLEADIREALKGAECEVPRKFSVTVGTAESGPGNFSIDYQAAPKAVEMLGVGRLIVMKGRAEYEEYPLDKPRINVGRLSEITDAEQRVVRRNDVVFLEGEDDANSTVSRKHAHIRLVDGAYRICDDGSEFGTRVFREGRSVEVPAGDRRGERLRSGDEIFLGRASLRFEQE
jgi:hypothetical protein